MVKQIMRIHEHAFRGTARLILTFIFLCSCLLSYSQKLTFCESIDSNGNPNRVSSTFTIRSTGGFLEALVTLPHGVDAAFATYDIFHLNEENKESFESTIRQNIQPDFTWFSKKIVFHKSGTYNVYVYDDRDHLLCMGRITIKMQ